MGRKMSLRVGLRLVVGGGVLITMPLSYHSPGVHFLYTHRDIF